MRKSALLGRVSGIDTSALNFDDPTLVETELHQRMAEEIEDQRYALKREVSNARCLLSRLPYVGSYKQRVAWLREAGHQGVSVQGESEPVPFERAEQKYVLAMYMSEVARLRKLAGD